MIKTMRSGRLYAAIKWHKQHNKENSLKRAVLTVLTLLEHKPFDVNKRTDAQGNTYLHLAAERGMKEAVLKFLYYGADPTLKNKAGKDTYQLVSEKHLNLEKEIQQESLKFKEKRELHTHHIMSLIKDAKTANNELALMALVEDEKSTIVTKYDKVQVIDKLIKVIEKSVDHINQAATVAKKSIPHEFIDVILKNHDYGFKDCLKISEETLFRAKTELGEEIKKNSTRWISWVETQSLHSFDEKAVGKIKEQKVELQTKIQASLRFLKELDSGSKNKVLIKWIESEHDRVDMAWGLFVYKIKSNELLNKNQTNLKNELHKNIDEFNAQVENLQKEIKQLNGANLESLYHQYITLNKAIDQSLVQFVSALLTKDDSNDIVAANNCLNKVKECEILAQSQYIQLTKLLQKPIEKLNPLYSDNTIVTDGKEIIADAYAGNLKKLRERLGNFNLFEKMSLTDVDKKHLDEAKDLNEKDSVGRTALMLSAANSNIKCAEYLLKKHKYLSNKYLNNQKFKLHLNEVDKHGQNGLFLCARMGSIDGVTFYLLENNSRKSYWVNDVIEMAQLETTSFDVTGIYEKYGMINLEALDKENSTVLMRAVTGQTKNTKSQIAILAVLLKEIKQHNQRIHDMCKVVSSNLKEGKQEYAIKINAELNKHLINIQKCDNNGRNILHLACGFGQQAVLQELLRWLKENLTVEVIKQLAYANDNDGMTPLMLASALGRDDLISDIVAFYNDLKLDLDQTHTKLQFTALDYVIYQRKLLCNTFSQNVDTDNNKQLQRYLNIEILLKKLALRSVFDEVEKNKKTEVLLESKIISPKPSSIPQILFNSQNNSLNDAKRDVNSSTQKLRLKRYTYR